MVIYYVSLLGVDFGEIRDPVGRNITPVLPGRWHLGPHFRVIPARFSQDAYNAGFSGSTVNAKKFHPG